MTTGHDDNATSAKRSADHTRYGFYTVLVGLLAVLAIYVVAVLRWDTAGEVAAAVSAAGSLIGTIVGAFFGLQAGSAGRERADHQRNVAQERALTLAAALEPNQFEAVRQLRRDLFDDQNSRPSGAPS